MAGGLTDPRGEATVIVPGIPISNFVTEEEQPDDDIMDHDDWLASGDVVKKETPVKLTVVVEEKMTDTEFPWPVDPDLLEEKHNLWRRKIKTEEAGELKDDVELKLKTGQTKKITLLVKVP